MTPPAENLHDALQALVRAQFPGATEVRALERLSAGASMETWSFDAVGATSAVALILRRRPPGAPHADQYRLLSTEATVIQAAAAGGVPVPTVRYVLRSDDGLGGGFVMLRIEGETIPRRMLRDKAFDAAGLLQQVGAAAARIHSNALELVRRQVGRSADDDAGERQRLAALLGREGSLEELNRALCQRIAAGEIDLTHAGLVEHLRAATLAKIAVDQPSYASYARALQEWNRPR